jgi:hypothetical protein
MGLNRIILERKTGSIAMETSTFKGARYFVLRRGWNDNGTWRYKKEGINFNKTSFNWLVTNLSENMKDIVEFFQSNEVQHIDLPSITEKVLGGSSYEVVHDNAQAHVNLDTIRNSNLKNADRDTLAQTLLCLDNALHDYFDEHNESEIAIIHSLMATQLKSAQWDK